MSDKVRRSQNSGSSHNIPDNVLLEDIERVVDKLDAPPTRAEYDELGDYAATMIATRFGNGSWYNVLHTLGYHDESFLERQIDREALIADVRHVADEVGQPPTQQEYKTHGEYSLYSVTTRLGDGSWIRTLERVGFESSNREQYVSDEALREDVARLTAELGHPPTSPEYKEHGTYAPITIARRFGDGLWSNALESLGYDLTTRPGTVTDDALREAVADVVEEFGRPPTRGEFAARSEFEPQTVANRFGNGLWRDAFANLGYDVLTLEEPNAIPDRTLRNDLERVIEKIGRIPNSREYDEHGEFSAQTIGNRFGGGSWSDALDALGYDPSDTDSSRPIPADTLGADVRRVVNELGKQPTIRDYERMGEYSSTTVANRLGGGSWTKAVQKVGVLLDEKEGDDPSS